MNTPWSERPVALAAHAAAAVAQVAAPGLAMLAMLALALLPAAPLDGLLRYAGFDPARPSGSAHAARLARAADFGDADPSVDARRVADWVATTNDSRGARFVVIDKREARLYVFDNQARLRATSWVLLGAALGDDSVPGIGERPVELVRPEERTTPAGRFVTEHGRNARGEDVVWVDYGAAVSMHRVVTHEPGERRLERLASPSVDDNRISYGCINLPVAFYESHIGPAFTRHAGVVYILPDVGTIEQVFGF